MTEELLEKLIIEFIDKFDIKKKVGFRYTIIKLFRENEDKNNSQIVADFIATTLKFKGEEANDNK